MSSLVRLRRGAALISAVALALCLGTRPTSALGLATTLELVGHDTIGSRGLNAGLAVAGKCAYVGSRGQGPVAIVDVSDPANPRDAGSIAGRPNTTARELRAVDDLHVLVVMSYALGAGGANRFDFYRWQSDCTRPVAE